MYQFRITITGQSGKSVQVDTVGDDMTTFAIFSGLILMIGYMAFDSFTSNWQVWFFHDLKYDLLGGAVESQKYVVRLVRQASSIFLILV